MKTIVKVRKTHEICFILKRKLHCPYIVLAEIVQFF